MTPATLIERLFNGKGLTVETKHQGTVSRVQKAKNMAERQKIPWTDVLAAMTDDQRQQVEHHG